MSSFDHIYVLLLALIMDAVLGDPRWLYSRINHPVVIIGTLIRFLDKRLNKSKYTKSIRKFLGIISISIILGGTWFLGEGIEMAVQDLTFGFVIQAIIVSIFLAQNSLYRHVAAVANACKSKNLSDARKEICHIVGRDPASLDKPAICRASIESLSENFCDGVIAPVVWYLICGLPGLLAYKALNTSDSMVGYLNSQYEDYGWCTARLDDLANFVPARLSAISISVASLLVPLANPLSSIRAGFRHAHLHRSVNAGWPEAAMAGALGIRIAGPRHYSGKLVDDAWMGDGRADVGPSDIMKGLRIYFVACGLTAFWILLWCLMDFFLKR